MSPHEMHALLFMFHILLRWSVMETTLHRQLKSHYAHSAEQIEVVLGKYRIDVIRDDELIEIQCASLSAIRPKIIDLLKRHRVRVIKPTVDRTRICRRLVKLGEPVSRRLSPKRGCTADLFEELIYFRGVFPNENLTLEFPVVDVNQYRFVGRRKKRRRRDPGYVVEDTELTKIHRTIEIHTSAELWCLLPDQAKESLGDIEFNTNDLADSIGCARWIAQRVAYVMRHSGAIEAVGRDKNGVRYRCDDSTDSCQGDRAIRVA